MLPSKSIVRCRAIPMACALILITCAPLTVFATRPIVDALVGTWALTKFLDSSEISSIDDVEAARLVGKTVVIAPDTISVAGKKCPKPPRFTHHYEDAARYVRETAHARVGRLDVPTTVEAVDLTCTEALIKGPNRIVIYWEGYFFDAIKQEQRQ